MNMDELSIVKYGDVDSLQGFLFENGMQHKLFREILMDEGKTVPAFPIMTTPSTTLATIGFDD